MKQPDRSLLILKRLKSQFPDAHCELIHENPFQLTIATILSAQCTDARVNMVTPVLFKKFPTPKKLALAEISEIENIIKSTGFFRNKAKNIKACAEEIVSIHHGEVPQTMEELSALSGVGRKTANVVLGNAFNINEGIVVDTHVKRISSLLKLTKSSQPEKIEKDLIKLFPQEDWTLISHLFIFLGRKTCIARRPKCSECSLNDLCPSALDKT